MRDKVTIDELVKRSGVSRSTIYRQMVRGMPYEIINSRVYFDLGDVYQFLKYGIGQKTEEKLDFPVSKTAQSAGYDRGAGDA